MSNDYASMHDILRTLPAEMKQTEWLKHRSSHMRACVVHVYSIWAGVCQKPKSQEAKLVRCRPLICWRKDRQIPSCVSSKNTLVSFRVRLWCWVKGNGINPFVKITRPFTTSPKAWKLTASLSPQVQIITMMSGTVDYRGKSTVAGTKAVAEAGFFSNMHHALWLDTMDKALKQTVAKPSWPASFDISARW